MAETKTTWDLLHDARRADVKVAYDEFWRAFMLAYTGSEAAFAFHPQYLTMLYPWYKNTRALAWHLNGIFKKHGYDRDVRMLLDSIDGPDRRMMLIGPALRVYMHDILISRPHEIAVDELTKLFTYLGHAETSINSEFDIAAPEVKLVLQNSNYADIFCKIAAFLREHEHVDDSTLNGH